MAGGQSSVSLNYSNPTRPLAIPLARLLACPPPPPSPPPPLAENLEVGRRPKVVAELRHRVQDALAAAQEARLGYVRAFPEQRCPIVGRLGHSLRAGRPGPLCLALLDVPFPG